MLYLRRAALTAAATAALLGVAPAGIAAAVPAKKTCDAYSGKCTEVKGVKLTKPPTTTDNSSVLPFTGGDVAVLGLVAVGSLGAGTVLVASGRRRKRANT